MTSSLNFEELFPLASVKNADEYLGTCRFYFENQPDILAQCIDFIQQHRDTLLQENRFALEACRQANDRTVTCCKSQAHTNDMAYQMCVNELVNPPATSMNTWTYVGGAFFLLILFLYILIFVVWKFFF